LTCILPLSCPAAANPCVVTDDYSNPKKNKWIRTAARE
jgi:hypothetical protein